MDSEMVIANLKRDLDEAKQQLADFTADICALEKKEEEIRLKEQMSNTLNQMSIEFLSQDHKPFEEKMTAGVSLIADMMELGSISAWRNYKVGEVWYTTQMYRWDREAGGTTTPRPQLQNVPLDKLTPDWEQILVGKKTLNGPVKLMEAPPMALQAFGVVSALLTPLYFNNAYWGFVLFEDLHKERYFDDVDFMRSSAFLFANTLLRFEMEDKLKKAAHAANAASKAKGQFLSNMSHEIRTPLNAIIGMASIGTTSDDIDRKDDCFKKINDASKHLMGVINDILDISKIEAGKFELSLTAFDFKKMIDRVSLVNKFRIEERQQTLTIELDESIPPSLMADEQRLAQVITNLLGNSIKFTPETGAIKLDAKLVDKVENVCTIQFAVTDTGIGISQEQQAKLFQSFQQAEASTTRKYGGTGLGLAISKSIVEMMGGKIWIESEQGKGATFFFTVQAEPVDETIQEATTVPIANQFEGYKILLVEDIEINREIVQALLAPTKIEIDCAYDGSMAVEMYRKNAKQYHGILMDIQMPTMDGVEATKRIRALEEPKAKTVPIIAMTANVFTEDVRKYLKAGMDDHVGKPLNIEEVVEKLRKCLIG
jgi:signal transduction histidine kinase/ActR/RegA family two-component response regulator